MCFLLIFFYRYHCNCFSQNQTLITLYSMPKKFCQIFILFPRHRGLVLRAPYPYFSEEKESEDVARNYRPWVPCPGSRWAGGRCTAWPPASCPRTRRWPPRTSGVTAPDIEVKLISSILSLHCVDRLHYFNIFKLV